MQVHYVKDTRDILEVTPLMFSTIKDGIMELLDDRLRAFRIEKSAR